MMGNYEKVGDKVGEICSRELRSSLQVSKYVVAKG